MLAGLAGLAWMLHAPHHDAQGAGATEALSIEDAIWEAVDDYADFPEVDWAYWLGVNPDIVGWITIPDTKISHPIVQASSDDPAFYLSHGIDGGDDPMGCIFLDSECGAGLDSMHSVIYGHNWNGGRMFADLARYSDRDFASSHGQMLLQTPSSKARLAVQCVEIANGTDSTNVIGFANADEMSRWYDLRLQASSIRLAQEAESGSAIDRIYTLCTCANGGGDRRVLVYAIPAMKLRADSRDEASTA